MNNRIRIPLPIIFLLIFSGLTILGIYYSYKLLQPKISASLNPPEGKQIVSTNSQVIQLANKAGMTELAKNIFYATNPQIDTDRNLFNQHCSAPISKNTVELGCYTYDNHIYILNITNPQLSGEMVVVAAHEMLHAVYAKEDIDSQNLINSEVEIVLQDVKNKNLTAELKQYNTFEPGQRDNELHSILGTEYASLDIPLEEHYAKYFLTRNNVVNYSNQFKQVFSSLQSQLTTTIQQIKTVKKQMQLDLSTHNISAYNHLVPQVNTLIISYNDAVQKYNQLSRTLQGPENALRKQ